MDQRAPPPLPRGPGFEYRYLTEFQSHEPEFDYLKSLEIEEKINKVRWVRSSSNTKHIISTNDKTIKLWKVYEKRVASVTGFNVDRSRWEGGPARPHRHGCWLAEGRPCSGCGAEGRAMHQLLSRQ
jgi:serine/threonine-protein phosphatase 2A regulatory subunit B